MNIKDDKIWMKDCALELGDSFTKVRQQLRDVIYLEKEPGESGSGYILIEHQEFYGFYCNCRLSFSGGVLETLALNIDWSKNKYLDENGKRLPVDAEVKLIGKVCEEQLQDQLQLIADNGRRGKVFVSGKIQVMACCDRFMDDYLVNICCME